MLGKGWHRDASRSGGPADGDESPTGETATRSATDKHDLGPIIGRSIRTEVFFGMSRPDGTLVPKSDWDNFVETQIESCFPNGFTEIPGRGNYRGNPEPVRILIVVHRHFPGWRTVFHALAFLWKKDQHQVEVLAVHTPCESESL